MAKSIVSESRVTVTVGDGKDFAVVKAFSDRSNPPSPRQVIEHVVLLNFPYLQGDQEASILRTLYNVQFQFENLIQLSVGRVLNNQNLCTHALVIRFPNIQVLLDYYRSDVYYNVSAKIAPYLHGQYIVDYLTPINDRSNYGSTSGNWINLTLLTFKDRLQPGTVENIIKSLLDLGQLPNVNELTVGENLVIKDGKFSHAFGVYFSSAEDLDRFSHDPVYASFLNDKVVPATAKISSVQFLAFRPVLSARL